MRKDKDINVMDIKLLSLRILKKHLIVKFLKELVK
jgi:hypothetical protein